MNGKRASSATVVPFGVDSLKRYSLDMIANTVPIRKKKLRRAEKAQANRSALIHAAAAVIGEHGYEGASISRITERAGLAQGTFYSYFDSREQLFDVLLPEITAETLRRIGEHVRGARNIFEVEERGFRAFLEIFGKEPGFFRVINEAEVIAPHAFNRHLDQVLDRYVVALKRGRKAGDIVGLDPRDFKVAAYMLIGARNYLFLYYKRSGDGVKQSLKSMVDTYMRIVRSVLCGPGATQVYAQPAVNRGRHARMAEK